MLSWGAEIVIVIQGRRRQFVKTYFEYMTSNSAERANSGSTLLVRNSASALPRHQQIHIGERLYPLWLDPEAVNASSVHFCLFDPSEGFEAVPP